MGAAQDEIEEEAGGSSAEEDERVDEKHAKMLAETFK